MLNAAEGRGAVAGNSRLRFETALGSLYEAQAGVRHGDGNLDFMVANSGNGTVSVLLGNGRGTFSAGADYATGAPAYSDFTGPAGPASVAVGDVDGDGSLDIVSANNYTGTVAVLKGKCNGTFDSKVEYPVGKTPYSAEIGDLNGDGKLDIVAANQDSNSVSVLLGNGDATFASKVDYATDGGPRRVKLGDLNGDHQLDIVTVNVSSDSVSVLLGNGDGTFGEQSSTASSNIPTDAPAALGDLNGDGNPDLVIAAYQDQVSVLMGTGNGTFAGPVEYTAAGYLSWLALGDLNGDGNSDILFAGDEYVVGALFGRGDGTFATEMSYGTVTSVVAAALGDLNGDNALDIALAFSTEPGTSVGTLIGTGDATFAHGYPATGSGTGAVAVADINGDGILDIVKAGEVDLNSGAVSVLLGTAAHGFALEAEYAISLAAGSVALADVNSDGKLDIVAAANDVQAATNPAVSVLLGNGDGTYGGELKLTIASRVSSIATADLNGDNMADIVATTEAGMVSVLLATGDGQFAAPVDYTAEHPPVSVAVGDVNRDGKLDIVVANNGQYVGTDSSVRVMLGQGGGAFATEVDYPSTYPINSVALGDLNHDYPFDAESIAVGDLNGDGRPDLAVTSWLGAVDVMLNSYAVP